MWASFFCGQKGREGEKAGKENKGTTLYAIYAIYAIYALYRDPQTHMTSLFLGTQKAKSAA